MALNSPDATPRRAELFDAEGAVLSTGYVYPNNDVFKHDPEAYPTGRKLDASRVRFLKREGESDALQIQALACEDPQLIHYELLGRLVRENWSGE